MNAEKNLAQKEILTLFTSVEDGNGNDADVPADRDDPLNDATFVVDQVRVLIDDATFFIA